MNSIKRKALVSLFFFFFVNCSRIQPMTTQNSDYYGRPFMAGIFNIKKIYKEGKKDEALVLLANMDKKTLLASENAFRLNLMGVIYFSKSEYANAITQFNGAVAAESPDRALLSQVYLNLSSTYYKIDDYKNSGQYLSLVDDRLITPEEVVKFHHLRFIFAKKEGNNRQILESLVLYFQQTKTLAGLKDDPLSLELENAFFQLERSDRLRALRDFPEDKQLIAVPYLGLLEVQREHAKGEMKEMGTLVQWMKEKYSSFPEIIRQGEELAQKVESSSKINPQAIGVVLPFSGKRKKFAEETMKGIDTAFKSFFSHGHESQTAPVIHIRDSMGHGVSGAYAVKELIEKQSVSIIIGGLFSDEAAKEYLEAKSSGTFFISLSPVYLPKDQKDHLLLEIPGSVESQVKAAFSKNILDKFGKKVALLVPKDDRGQAYVEASWGQADANGVQIINVQNYVKDATDFRDPIKSLLGLSFKRERKEETEMMNQLASLQVNQSSARKVQSLPPVIDFDWVYTPAFPDEALRLIPIFKYYDAFGVSFVGGPSWRSKGLSHLTNTEPLYFVGDDLNEGVNQFRKSFFSENKKWPGLMEMISYNAVKVASFLLSSESFSSRPEFESRIREKGKIEGIGGNWKFENNLWIKEMTALKFHRNNISGLLQDDSSSPAKNAEGDLI